MDPFDRQVPWDDRYRAAGPQHVSWYEAEPRLSLDLVALVGAGPGTSVIDVGGGGSMLTPALLSSGFTDLTVLDVSAEALSRRSAPGSWNLHTAGLSTPLPLGRHSR